MSILVNVTTEFLSKATPGTGNVIFEIGFKPDKHKEEVRTAFWLLNTFGGEIIVLNEKFGYKLKNPDYKWNGKFWELKGVSSRASLENGIRKATKQIMSNSGGIIIDICNYKDKLSTIYGTIKNILCSYKIKSIYIIIKKRRNTIGIYYVK